jgi:hypothetical protein
MSSSDAYEPAFDFERNNAKSTIANNFDLRNFLRSKQQQQQDVSQTVNYQYQIEYDQAEQQQQQQQQYSNEQTNRIVTNLADLDYSEPITQPISIGTKYGYNRYRSNSNSYTRKLNERCRYLSSDVDGSRVCLNGSVVNLANVDGETGQIGENRDGESNGFNKSEEYQAQNDDLGEEDTDDEEEEDLRRKKIRSVVVAKAIVPNEKCKCFCAFVKRRFFLFCFLKNYQNFKG